MKFKSPKVESRWDKVHPQLRNIIIDGDDYVKEKYDIELMIVETATTEEEDRKIGRIEPMHREEPYSRAVDIRTFDVAKHILDDLKEYLLKKYGHMGAHSRGSGVLNLVFDKPHGTGPHWHVQIQRGLPL